jgi:hypothetical protein
VSTYSEFFLKKQSYVMEYETVAIAHPDMTQAYRLVRNAPDGINAGGQDYTYAPMAITPSGTKLDLDFGIEIVIADIGAIIAEELSVVRAAGGLLTRPVVVYQTFASNALGAPLVGPFNLEVVEFSLTSQGAAFQCRPMTINRNKTGMLYLPRLFPTLEGFR